MNKQGLSAIQARVDELYVLGEQAQARLSQLNQQQTEFVSGCNRLFHDMRQQAKGMKTTSKLMSQVSKKIEQDLQLSQRRVRTGIQLMFFASAMMVGAIVLGFRAWNYYLDFANQPQIISVSMLDDNYVLITEDSVVEFGEEEDKRTYAKLRYID